MTASTPYPPRRDRDPVGRAALALARDIQIRARVVELREIGDRPRFVCESRLPCSAFCRSLTNASRRVVYRRARRSNKSRPVNIRANLDGTKLLCQDLFDRSGEALRRSVTVCTTVIALCLS